MTISVLTGDPTTVVMGAGVLFVAPIGTTEPTTVAGVTGSSAWREVGWTDKGSVIDNNVTISPVDVEEEFYSVVQAVTKIESSVGFAAKQANRRNLALANNAGAAAANDATSFEPPTPGAEVRVMVALVTLDGALWVFRRCINGGNVSINRQKAPNAVLLPIKFSLEKPVGKQPWICFPNAAGLI